MKGPLLQMWQILSEWALAVAAVIGSTLLGAGGAFYRTRTRSLENETRSKANQRTAAENERRSKRNEQRIAGDEANPNHASLMDLAAENNDRIEDIEQTQDRILRAVDAIADELDGTFYRGDNADD